MKREDLQKILELHTLWLDGEEGGVRADLRSADLQYANLRYADLQYANLRSADLRGADLRGAYLQGADLRGADLQGADYNDTTIGLSNLCPEGDFIGWKKVNDYLIKLLIPADAKRSNATTYKCRCEFAKVLDICNVNNEQDKVTEVVNRNYANTVYQVGEIVRADSWDDDRWNECSNGIHFFIDKEMAKFY